MTTAKIQKEQYRVNLQNGNHLLIADEPLIDGGTDAGPSPDVFLETALASCTAITLRMYANRKNWPVNAIEVNVSLERIDQETHFTRIINIDGPIDAAQKERLLAIAHACPVSKTLLGKIGVKSLIN